MPYERDERSPALSFLSVRPPEREEEMPFPACLPGGRKRARDMREEMA